MINVFLLDDEDHCLELLRRHVANCDNLRLIGASDDHRAALEQIRAGNVDLLFSDIHMPDMQGTDLARLIAGACDIVFTTGYPEHAIEGFKLGVVHYLLKPISFGSFLEAVERYQERRPKAPEGGPEQTHLFVKSGSKGKFVKINFADIRYVEYQGDYIVIHHKDTRTLTSQGSMKEMEERLPAHSFVRIHRGYIVSRHHIGGIDGNQVVLSDNTTRLDISEQYRPGIRRYVGDSTLGQ